MEAQPGAMEIHSQGIGSKRALDTCFEASNSSLEWINTEEEGSFWSLGTDSPGRRTGSSKSQVDSRWNHEGTMEPKKLNHKAI
jgi:hypothetical protein